MGQGPAEEMPVAPLGIPELKGWPNRPADLLQVCCPRRALPISFVPDKQYENQDERLTYPQLYIVRKVNHMQPGRLGSKERGHHKLFRKTGSLLASSLQSPQSDPPLSENLTIENEQRHD